VTQVIVIPVLAIGLPASLLRLWLIWWKSLCDGCGLEHRACACGPGDHTMRPRR
jgi:hypothetical protein